MGFGKRLATARKSAGLSQQELAIKTGMTQGRLSLYETEKREPDVATIRLLAETLKVKADWLIGLTDNPYESYGKPLPLPYSDAALRIARQYDRLDGYGQATVSAVVREELNRCEAPPAELAEIIELPHSLLSASAGTGQWLDDDTAEVWEVRLNEHTRKADFAVDVAGDSMEPLYSDGDTVLVHAQPAINPGEIGLYVYQGDGYIKRQGDGRLESINPAYPDIVPCEGEAITCKGRVLGKLDAAWIVK